MQCIKLIRTGSICQSLVTFRGSVMKKMFFAVKRSVQASINIHAVSRKPVRGFLKLSTTDCAVLMGNLD